MGFQLGADRVELFANLIDFAQRALGRVNVQF
jgi:hypothetical protein